MALSNCTRILSIQKRIILFNFFQGDTVSSIISNSNFHIRFLTNQPFFSIQLIKLRFCRQQYCILRIKDIPHKDIRCTKADHRNLQITGFCIDSTSSVQRPYCNLCLPCHGEHLNKLTSLETFECMDAVMNIESKKYVSQL
ncbi:unnamed protein product [Paramecium octaurelia]|uniref:Uncharacterized protein n=1 Tax=Paramecium octaurelia TaxID=43137 RepID=A0A8S1Y741_PAROT|nr:unnamed protein product [Paramecium octaurelia]